MHRTVIGAVVEKDRYAHVLFRELHSPEEDEIGTDGREHGHVRFTTLDKAPAGWRLRIDHTLLAQQGWLRVWRSESEEDDSAAEADQR